MVNVNLVNLYNIELQVDYCVLVNFLDVIIMGDIVCFMRKYYFDNFKIKDWGGREVFFGVSVMMDEQLVMFLSSFLSLSVYYFVGMCVMMLLELGGVVDEEFKVYGVKNLRVVDVSVILILLGVNICQMVYVVVEKVCVI